MKYWRVLRASSTASQLKKQHEKIPNPVFVYAHVFIRPRLHTVCKVFSTDNRRKRHRSSLLWLFFWLLDGVPHCKRLGLAWGQRQNEPQVGDVVFQLKAQFVQLVFLLLVHTEHKAICDFLFFFATGFSSAVSSIGSTKRSRGKSKHREGTKRDAYQNGMQKWKRIDFSVHFMWATVTLVFFMPCA